MPKMLIQGLGGTLRAQNWASRIPPSFSALKMGLETVSTNSWFLKKGIPEPGWCVMGCSKWQKIPAATKALPSATEALPAATEAR